MAAGNHQVPGIFLKDACTNESCAGLSDLLSSTTTTTLPDLLCGDANDDGKITAGDALFALRAAVGTTTCPLQVCDYTGDGKIAASDALSILRASVGQAVAANCPSLPPLTWDEGTWDQVAWN